MNAPCPHLALQRLPENGHAAGFECVTCHAFVPDLRIPRAAMREIKEQYNDLARARVRADLRTVDEFAEAHP